MNLKERMDNLLKRVTYKDNYSFAFTHPKGDKYCAFSIYRYEKDSSDHRCVKNVSKFVTSFDVPVEVVQFMTYDSIIGMLFSAVLRVELHEVKEFFKVDGKPYKDAHGAIELLDETLKNAPKIPEKPPAKKIAKGLEEIIDKNKPPIKRPIIAPIISPETPWVIPYKPYWPSKNPDVFDKKCE